MTRSNRRSAMPLALALVAAWLVSAGIPAPVRGADVTYRTPTAASRFGQGVEFSQPVVLPAVPARVELLITFPWSIGPLVIEVDTPTRAGATTLRSTFGGDSGALLPNTAMTARWRVTADDGTVSIGPPVDIRYEDTRFDWQTRSGDVVRVHWYEGGDAFGRQALAIGEQAVAKAEALLGVKESEPIDFYVYADKQAFYDAIGPDRENVGGQAHANIRTLFALIPPSSIDAGWVATVVPHELTHLVFDTAIRNPYNEPPHWLDEGLAVYLSQGYDDSDRGLVRDAARNGTLIPLDGLVGQFPTSQEGFFQAYAEAVSAVDFMVRTYGKDALVQLIRSYADGTSDDDAFKAALGVDTDGFDRAWFADLGVPVPSPQGPRPDVVGPLPADWAAPSGAPAASPTPGSPSAPAPIPDGTPGGWDWPLLLGGGLVILAVVVGLVVASSRRRPALPAGWSGGSDGAAPPDDTARPDDTAPPDDTAQQPDP